MSILDTIKEMKNGIAVLIDPDKFKKEAGEILIPSFNKVLFSFCNFVKQSEIAVAEENAQQDPHSP